MFSLGSELKFVSNLNLNNNKWYLQVVSALVLPYVVSALRCTAIECVTAF